MRNLTDTRTRAGKLATGTKTVRTEQRRRDVVLMPKLLLDDETRQILESLSPHLADAELYAAPFQFGIRFGTRIRFDFEFTGVDPTDAEAVSASQSGSIGARSRRIVLRFRPEPQPAARRHSGCDLGFSDTIRKMARRNSFAPPATIGDIFTGGTGNPSSQHEGKPSAAYLGVGSCVTQHPETTSHT